MEIQFLLTPEDLWHYYIYVYRHYLLRGFLLLQLGYTLLVLVALQLVYPFSPEDALPWFVFLFMLLLLPPLVTVVAMRRSISRNTKWMGERVVAITSRGLQQKSEMGEGIQMWQAIKAIAQDTHNFYFILDGISSSRRIVMGVVVPRHAFAKQEDAEIFLGRAQSYWRIAAETVLTQKES